MPPLVCKGRYLTRDVRLGASLAGSLHLAFHGLTIRGVLGEWDQAEIVVLAGPPGVGKSTLIAALASCGEESYDVEELGTDRASRDIAARRLVNETPRYTTLWLGGADLSHRTLLEWRISGRRVLIVYLLPPLSVYEQRRARRDARRPEKCGQGDHYAHFLSRSVNRAEAHFSLTFSAVEPDALSSARVLMARVYNFSMP